MNIRRRVRRFYIPLLVKGKRIIKGITPRKYWKDIQILHFYSTGFTLQLLALLGFSMLLAMMETFQIVLLYPILDASFNLGGEKNAFFDPLYYMVRTYMDLPDLVAFCLLFILFVFLTFVVKNCYTLISLTFTKGVIIKIKASLFQKLMTNEYRYFVDTGQGDILYKVVSAPASIKTFLETSSKIIVDVVMILSILMLLFLLSPIGMIILIIIGTIFFSIVRVVGNRYSYVIGKIRMKSVSSENKVISEYVHGIRQIRSVSGDLSWRREYDLALNNYWDKYVKFKFTEQLPNSILHTLFYSSVGLIVIAIFYIYEENFFILLPLIGTFAYSALKLLPNLTDLSSKYVSIMDSWPNVEDIYHFLLDRKYDTIRNGKEQFSELVSDIQFKNVGFSYNPGQNLIEDLNLTIRKNGITALVGLSGSGKSTVVSLLLRYYDVSEGQILINGTDLREYDIATFLSRVGYVSQDTFIFNASIRDNIAFGGGYTDEEVIEASKKANIHAFINSLKHGYESMVGDRGIKLSGGEKQRIAIARALVRKPEFLVLDEATSNLDNESEAIVQESINRVSETITTFIIAHRLSTIRRADVIYVMSKGRIVESGNHEELLEMKGKYWELYETGG